MTWLLTSALVWASGFLVAWGLWRRGWTRRAKRQACVLPITTDDVAELLYAWVNDGSLVFLNGRVPGGYLHWRGVRTDDDFDCVQVTLVTSEDDQ